MSDQFPTPLPKLSVARARALLADWPWLRAYWTPRHADARAIYDAAMDAIGPVNVNNIFIREMKHFATGKRGWLLIRVQ